MTMMRGEWPTLDFVLTNAPDGVARHIDALAARLAAAERERDAAIRKWTAETDTLAARLAAAEQELVGMARNVRVRIPTDTMEQEFARYYRRGYGAGKRSAEREREENEGVIDAAMERQP